MKIAVFGFVAVGAFDVVVVVVVVVFVVVDDDDDDDISHVVVVAVGWLKFIIGSGCLVLRVDNESVSAF